MENHMVNFEDAVSQHDLGVSGLYSLGNTCKIMGVKPRAIYSLVKRGLLEAVNVNRRILWITHSTLEAYIIDDCCGNLKSGEE